MVESVWEWCKVLEKRFIAVPPQVFTADGDGNGYITVANATLFKVKQHVYVNATSLPQLELEVKRVNSITQLIVGPRGGNINAVIDISIYTVAANANISAIEQKRPPIDYAEIWRAVYAEEPAVALRNLLVDKLGNDIDSVTDSNGVNRLAVDAQLVVEDIEIGKVDQGIPNTPANAWPVEIYGPNGNVIEPNADGSINIKVSKSIGLFNMEYDAIAVSYPSGTVENYQSYLNGLSGTPVQLVIVTYLDSTKDDITSVTRTPAG